MSYQDTVSSLAQDAEQLEQVYHAALEAGGRTAGAREPGDVLGANPVHRVVGAGPPDGDERLARPPRPPVGEHLADEFRAGLRLDVVDSLHPAIPAEAGSAVHRVSRPGTPGRRRRYWCIYRQRSQNRGY